MIKHYVEFTMLGGFFYEYSTESIDHRDSSKVKVPKNAFAFRFFDREEVESNGEILKGDRKNYSSLYYVGGEIMTLAQVKKQLPQEEILINNMEINNWDKVIKHRFGGFQPFEKDNVLLPETLDTKA